MTLEKNETQTQHASKANLKKIFYVNRFYKSFKVEHPPMSPSDKVLNL